LFPPYRLFLPVLLLPCAWLVAYRGSVVPITWVRLFVMGAVCLGGPLLASFDRRWQHRGFAPLLLAASAVGMYFTVPEVRFISVLLAAALALTVLGWPFPLASLGANGSLPVVGLVAWTMALDGYKRSSSIIAGVACLGLLLVEPLARLVHRRLDDLLERAMRPWWSIAPLVLTHLVMVYVASRVAGLEISPTPAAVIAGADLGIALVVLVAVASAHERRARREAASSL
ncbi:MAG TPA: hypothetical protein VEI97_04275, partial [bacterium]|nr:hypothetical protein [bacterium]